MSKRIISLALLCAAFASAEHVVLIEGDRTASTRELRAVEAREFYRSGLSPQQSLAIVTDQQERLLLTVGLRVIPAPASVLTQDRVALCGNVTPSIPPGNRPPASNTMYPGPGWDGEGNVGSAVLTYTWGNMSPPVGYGAETNKSDVLAAAAQWSSVAAVDLVPGTDPNGLRNVHVFFGPDAHGDYPFGPSLAHSFPASEWWSEPLWGDVHFNSEQRWGVNAPISREYRVACVALHEFGHALFRLGHSDDAGNAMYPFLGGANCALGGEDIYFARLEFAARYNPLPAFPPALAGDPGSGGGGGGGGDRGDRGGVALALSVAVPASTTESQVFVTVTTSGGTSPYYMRYSVNGAQPSSEAQVGSPYLIGPVDLLVGSNTVAVTVRDSAGASLTQLVSIQRTAGDGRTGR